mmetsp:Transcript_7048/g.43259  ORF Transcript_7048/g.43259 Transcript_7048/m.43259 type:complete len:268 (+) Transcript_7048:711-1514(+)
MAKWSISLCLLLALNSQDLRIAVPISRSWQQKACLLMRIQPRTRPTALAADQDSSISSRVIRAPRHWHQILLGSSHESMEVSPVVASGPTVFGLGRGCSTWGSGRVIWRERIRLAPEGRGFVGISDTCVGSERRRKDDACCPESIVRRRRCARETHCCCSEQPGFFGSSNKSTGWPVRLGPAQKNAKGEWTVDIGVDGMPKDKCAGKKRGCHQTPLASRMLKRPSRKRKKWPQPPCFLRIERNARNGKIRRPVNEEQMEASIANGTI